MSKPKILDFKEVAIFAGQKLTEFYWKPLYDYLKANEELKSSFTGFLLKPEKLVFYFGKTHLAVEYFGSETLNELESDGTSELTYHDLTRSDENFFEQIIGFKYDSTIKFEMPLPPFADELILPTNKGIDKLIELKWNFSAQDSLMAMNVGNIVIQKGQFARYINSLFFDANENGLVTRHIKWIDFIPLEYDDTGDEYDSLAINFNYYSKELVEFDCHYKYPLPDKDDFKFSKLPQINRFVELAGNKETTEPMITSFLDKPENKFILSMAFLAKEVHHQIQCTWQSEEKDKIIPDFLVVRPNGYADIVEFKLPYLKTNSVTGKANRESFSAEINSYISQTRVYKQYFEDPNNRSWFEKKYGFKVQNPRRILVVGRRWDFLRDEWKEIVSDYNDIEIMTYEDLVDGVVAQFYM